LQCEVRYDVLDRTCSFTEANLTHWRCYSGYFCGYQGLYASPSTVLQCTFVILV